MVGCDPRGRSTLGCLVALLLVVALAYFGVDVAGAYWRYYSFRDAMQQEARFAGGKGDADIVRRLQAKVDSLGLPNDAADVEVRRDSSGIHIASDYRETIKLPFMTREIGFHPRAERGF